MADLPFNIIDVVVVVVVLASALFALFRGFVHEVLAVAAWIGAAFAALYGFPLLSPFARKHIESDLIADGVAGGTIFVVVLILLSLVTHAISRRVHKSALNSADRSLGFVFGIARGVFLMSLAYMVVAWLYQENRPAWLEEARTRPVMAWGAGVIEAAMPAAYSAGEAQTKRLQDQARVADKAHRAFRELASPQPRAAEQPQETTPTKQGYGNSERQDLDRLFQSNK